MKKIIKLSYFLFVLLAIVSCSSDDDNNPEVNTVEIDGVSYDVDEASITDYGTYSGYYIYEFELEGSSSDDVPFHLYLDLYSKGTDAFRTGTFQFYGGDDVDAAPDFVFGYGDLSVDNGDYIEAVSGTVVITKNGDIYTISAQITLENDEVVIVSHSSEFTFYYEDITKVSSSPKSSRFFSVK